MNHHTKVTRKVDVIGCRIRPGMTPGGMTNQQCSGTKRHLAPRSHKAVIEAANSALEKRGWHRNPDQWRDSISQAVVEARVEKKQEPTL